MLADFIEKVRGHVYSIEDMPAIISYLEKVITQNDHLATEIKKLLDERERMQKRLHFYESVVNIRGIK